MDPAFSWSQSAPGPLLGVTGWEGGQAVEGYGHVALTVGQQSHGMDSVVVRYRHPTADSRPCGLADLQNQLR